jgi:hypothetical protein
MIENGNTWAKVVGACREDYISTTFFGGLCPWDMDIYGACPVSQGAEDGTWRTCNIEGRVNGGKVEYCEFSKTTAPPECGKCHTPDCSMEREGEIQCLTEDTVSGLNYVSSKVPINPPQ